MTRLLEQKTLRSGAILSSESWLWVKKKTPTGITGFGQFFPHTKLGFFGYPVTHSQLRLYFLLWPILFFSRMFYPGCGSWFIRVVLSEKTFLPGEGNSPVRFGESLSKESHSHALPVHLTRNSYIRSTRRLHDERVEQVSETNGNPRKLRFMSSQLTFGRVNMVNP